MIKTLCVLFLIMIPIFLLSSIGNYNSVFNSLHLKHFNNIDRTWRLNQIAGEYYAGDAWYQDSKSEYVYNSIYPTRIDTLRAYAWSNVEYILMMKIAYTYDQTGQYCTRITYFNVNGGLESLSSRVTLQYDEQNRVTMIVTDLYDSESSGWTLYSWHKYFYNADSINYVALYGVSDDEGYPFWERTDFVNDGAGRPTMLTRQISSDSLDWGFDKRTEIDYHANDTTTGNDYITAIGNQYTGSHALSFGTFFTHAMVILSTDLYYNSGWENDFRREYTYDAQNNVIAKLDKYWDTGWQAMMQTLYSYNANGNMDQATEYNWEGTSWGNSYRFTLTWGQETAVDENTSPAVNAMKITASPNPFTRNASIRVSTKTAQPVNLSVFNTRGQLVKDISAISNSNIRWDGKNNSNCNVPAGIYFIKAVSAGKSQAIKVLKIR